VFGPMLLTQTRFGITNFGGEEHNTGLVGDTIGGITTPIVTLISVILLYLALIKQIETSEGSKHEANFRIVYSEKSYQSKFNELNIFKNL
jgi:hypothetical protein